MRNATNFLITARHLQKPDLTDKVIISSITQTGMNIEPMDIEPMDIEPFEKRLKRFTDGPPSEIIGTLTNSITNLYLKEIIVAKQQKLTKLIFIGIHATIQTIAEKIYGKNGKEGTKFYLKNFLDGNTPDRQFSTISDDIHFLRNVAAHQWLSKQGHTICIKFDIPEGWKKDNGVLYINPDIYAEQYINGFKAKSQFWELWKQLPDEESQKLQKLQELKVIKYNLIADFLDLDRRKKTTDILAQEIKKLATTKDFSKQEEIVKEQIFKRYLSGVNAHKSPSC